MVKKLTPRKDAFIVEYAKTHNATLAAKRAGYSPRTAYSQGSRLLRNVEVQQRLEALGVIGLDTLARVAQNGTNELARVAAAKTLVEYALGKSSPTSIHQQNVKIKIRYPSKKSRS